MDRDLTTCLQTLQSEVAKITNDSARVCLSDFIEICGALCMAEVEDEHSSQTVVRMCREQILKTHQKSINILDILVNSDLPDKQSTIGSVVEKLKELSTISDTVDKVFRKARLCSQHKDDSSGNGQNEVGPTIGQKLLGMHNSAASAKRVKEVLAGLNELADMSQALQKEEDEVLATNRHLSQLLERLRVEAGTHPAIEAYTARNCKSAMAVRKRQEEYSQYAVSIERVLKKVIRATETFQASTQKDVASIVRNLPLLRTLSHTLAHLHTSAMDASALPEDMGASDKHSSDSSGNYGSKVRASSEGVGKEDEKDSSTNHSSSCGIPLRRMKMDLVNCTKDNSEKPVAQNSKDGKTNNTVCHLQTMRQSPQRNSRRDGEKVMAKKLTQALACIGCMRRQVDACLGQVGFTLTDSSLDWSDHSRGDGAPSTHSEEFKFLPLDDKGSQDQLIAGTKLLMSAINILQRDIKIKSSVMESQAVLDKALCRSFPETAIMRLDLLRLLIAQDENPVDSMPLSKVLKNKRASKSKCPTKVEKPNVAHEQSPELHTVVKKPPRLPKNLHQRGEELKR